MVLVERYVEAVRSHLPRRQRDDIAAELRDTLRSQMEAEEAEHGRRLSEEDVAGILKRYGAPAVVAARYSGSGHLIGPAVYPYYRSAVKAVLWVPGSFVAIALIVSAFTDSDPLTAMARVLWTGILIAVASFTIMTLIFARLERMADHADWAQHWDPRDLPHGVERRMSIPRAEAVAAVLLTGVWLLWWTDVLPLNHWLLWSRLPLAPAPIWDTLTPLIVGVMAANLIVNGVAIVRPRRVWFYEAAIVLIDLGVGVVLYRALRAPELIVLIDDRAPGAALAGLFNTLATIGVFAFALLVAVSIASTVRQWAVIEKRRREADSGAASLSRL